MGVQHQIVHATTTVFTNDRSPDPEEVSSPVETVNSLYGADEQTSGGGLGLYLGATNEYLDL